MPNSTKSDWASAEFTTRSPEEADEFISGVYSPVAAEWGYGEDFEFGVAATQLDAFGVHRVHVNGTVAARADPYGQIYVFHQFRGRSGWGEGRAEVRAVPGDLFLLAPDCAHTVHAEAMRLGVVRLRTEDAVRVGAEVTGSDPAQLRIQIGRPVSQAAARHWKATVRYVAQDVLTNPEAIASPLARSASFHLLAMTFFSTFPTPALVVRPADAPWGHLESSVVRRAIAFIDANAHRDITVTDIALAARVSVRGLQQAFRRHLDSTPMTHLISVRMSAAHRDLQRADPTRGDTVRAIAAAWGFPHQGRFASRYRRLFGTSPRHTLDS